MKDKAYLDLAARKYALGEDLMLKWCGLIRK
jgi:hypothetical protein